MWKVPLTGEQLPGGEEIQVLNKPAAWESSSWALGRNGIYFFNDENAPQTNIEFLPFAIGKRSLIVSVDRCDDGLAVSPDNKSIVFAKNEAAETSITLVKNFR